MHTTILNMDYSHLAVVSWQKGITLLFKGVVQPIEFYENYVKSAGGESYQVPKMVVVKKYIKHRPKIKDNPTKRNIITRDKYTCVYCGLKFNGDELTLDHILPKSKGGKNSWENLVTSCKPCNNRKADRTPDEAKMPLLYEV